MVHGKRWPASTRATSSTAATPEASSLAPGASAVAFITSVTRESIWPLISSTRVSVGSVPGSVASTLAMSTLRLIRLPSGCTVKVSSSTVSRPPPALPYFWNSASTHCRAAPMPRVLLWVSLSVWRVP